MRAAIAVVLSALLALSPLTSAAAPLNGVFEGTVTVDGRPLDGLELSLVDVQTGAVQRVKSAGQGAFRAEIPAGRYIVSSDGRAGLSVGRAPAVVTVVGGQVVSARIELLAAATATTHSAQGAPAATTATIQHEAVDCLKAGEHPVFEARVEPAAQVAKARLYFRSNVSPEWYYTEMVNEGGVWRGWLPKPTVQASPVTYYIMVTTSSYGEPRTPEIPVTVVENDSDCKGKMAPVGTPPAGLTIISASSGAVAAPAGFVAVSAAGIGAGTLILAGILLAGGGVAISQIGGASPSPAASASPSPVPSPSASPSASPSPAPRCPDGEPPLNGVCTCAFPPSPTCNVACLGGISPACSLLPANCLADYRDDFIIQDDTCRLLVPIFGNPSLPSPNPCPGDPRSCV